VFSTELKQHVLLQWTKSRIDKNKNVILIINGETGGGKTYAGLDYAVKCAKMLRTKFSIENNVDFNFVRLLEKMEDIEGNKEPGTVFLLEEVGAYGSGAGSKQWQSKANQFFSSFGQTSRHLRQIFIMTCPSFTMLQKDTRELCHMQWEMICINPSNKLSFVKARRIQVNRTSGKMYMKYLRFNVNGQRYTLKKLPMNLPPKDIIKEYEIAKSRFTSKLNRKIIEQSKPKKKELTEKQENWYKLWQSGMNMEETAKKLGISLRSCYDYRKSVLKKGYSLEK